MSMLAGVSLFVCLAAAPVGEDPQVVFKLRRGATGVDPGALLVAGLGNERRAARAWKPQRLRRVFAHRIPRGDVDEPAAGFDRVYVSDLPPGATLDALVARLAADPRIEFAQPDHVRESHQAPNDPFYHSSGSWGQSYRDLWALPKLNVEHAWVLSRGAGVVVAVVDSGVDYPHPELASQMWTNPEEQGVGPDNGYPGDTLGWDFVANDNDPRDEFGHGTHMAGIIAAQADNGLGIAGVAPAVRLMAVRAISGAGQGTSSTIAAGIVYAADNGAQVITVSSGCAARCPFDPLVEQAVRHASTKGAIVVVSAGNRGDDLAFYSPQNMADPRPIVVGATDELDQRESFGNAGELVDLAAPGGGRNPSPGVHSPVSNILSLASSSCSPLVCDAPLLVGDGQYLRRSGTSMSAAYVSGVAALVLAEDPLANLQSVRQRLFGNAQDLGPKGHDAMFGWGRLTALNAVADLRRYILARIVAPASGQKVSGLVRISGAAHARTFSSYELSVGAGASPATWQTAGVTLVGSPTPQGDLGGWNTAGLTPGTWTIRLVVLDTIGGRREHRRTVTVEPTPAPAPLVLDVASDGLGTGTVHLDLPRAFCDAVAGSTHRCSYTYGGPAQVTLTAVPEGPSAFAGWSGACSGTGPCLVDLAARRDVRATFRGPYHLAVKVTVINGGVAAFTIDPPDPACDSGEPCRRYSYRPGTVVTVTGFDGAPFSSFSWTSPVCSGNICTVVMDQDWLLEGVVSDSSDLFEMTAYAGPDQRVPAGTPTTLWGSVYNPLNLQPVSYQWVDDATGTLLGEADMITIPLGFGLHQLRFYVLAGADENFMSAQDFVQVLVHDP